MQPVRPNSTTARAANAVVSFAGDVCGSFALRENESIALGRSLEVEVPLDDRFSSRRHCELSCGPQGVTLVDLDSANGTFLNGERVHRVAVHTGDLLEVGHSELRLTVEIEGRPHLNATTRDRAARPLPAPPPPPAAGDSQQDLVTKLADERYQVTGLLSRRGLISVYQARKLALDQVVALKVLPLRPPVSRKQMLRFAQGAQAQAPLRHRNIVAIYDVRKLQDMLFLVMELVDGETLQRKVERSGGRLSTREALLYAYQIAGALAHAHGRGVIHRDVKPGNIMVTREREAKLIDFGIAKCRAQAAGAQELTGVGESLGTPGYMAPEQAGNATHADGRADVYGLGATLYFCLAGRAPFPTVPGPPPGEPPLVPLREIPGEVTALVVKMLQPRPQDRFQTAVELQRAIERVVSRLTRIQAGAQNTELVLRMAPSAAAEEPYMETPPRAWRLPVSPAFRGQIRNHELVEFLQMLDYNQKSGTLEISAYDEQGHLLMREGRIVRARTEAGACALAAVKSLLMVRDGEFAFSPHPVGVVEQDTDCDLPIAAVLLDHLRTADEAGRGE